MDDGGPTASYILFMILLLINAFFYGFGAAISALNGKEVERKAQDKNKKAIRLQRMMDNPSEYVNTVQLITTFNNVVIGACYFHTWLNTIKRIVDNSLAQNAGMQGIPTQVTTITALVLTMFLLLYILLTLGVLLPKRIAVRMSEKWAYACVTPIFYITGILRPITGLITVTVSGILFLFGVRDKLGESDVTEEEIINMVNEGHEQGLIQASEAEMISNIFEFGDKEAQDIMTHRNNITAIDGETKLQDAITFMLAGKNSRYPVYEENIDHIIGILHLKDAMRFHSDVGNDRPNRPIRELDGLMREPYFVPQTKNIDELFKEMQSKKMQMVIVVDEYGQTDGLVAMEDILEEIVGNIMDEYDEDKEYIEEKGNDEYIIEGKTPLEDLEEHLGIHFDNEDFETLNGYLISKMDKIPEPDEDFDIDCDGYNFKVLLVENKMIQSVLVTKLPEKEGEDTEDEVSDESTLEEKQK